MSIAIQITTFASEEDARQEVEQIRKIAARLQKATAEGKPATTWRIFGTTFAFDTETGVQHKHDVRVDEDTLAAEADAPGG